MTKLCEVEITGDTDQILEFVKAGK
jgi:hypothetical protein